MSPQEIVWSVAGETYVSFLANFIHFLMVGIKFILLFYAVLLGVFFPSKLQKVTMPIITDADCRSQYSNSEIADSMLCAGDTGKDSCQVCCHYTSRLNLCRCWCLSAMWKCWQYICKLGWLWWTIGSPASWWKMGVARHCVMGIIMWRKTWCIHSGVLFHPMDWKHNCELQYTVITSSSPI